MQNLGEASLSSDPEAQLVAMTKIAKGINGRRRSHREMGD
jgi:hypothetical protein